MCPAALRRWLDPNSSTGIVALTIGFSQRPAQALAILAEDRPPSSAATVRPPRGCPNAISQVMERTGGPSRSLPAWRLGPRSCRDSLRQLTTTREKYGPRTAPASGAVVYDDHAQHRSPLADFTAAYNFAPRVKPLDGLAPSGYISKMGQSGRNAAASIQSIKS